ncbi:hypothetical protein J5N97_028528 [Dioscorea zingiberensis]|uniref:Pentatricopeptide repeat-containing protein n=1 Tax=Dioscorea zingiberensis TaxID=325984 RepID=A0A9D5H4X2_9LILI|nr:hypothetical protein J5N97_028528 [Dioscorea zingiberensis]
MQAFSSLFRRSSIHGPCKPPECLAAQHLLGEMPHRNSTRLNALLSAHVRDKDPSSALLLFFQMHRHSIPLDGFSFNPVLAACTALPAAGSHLGRQVHALMLKTACASELIPATSLLDMYSKCGLSGDAVAVFDEMPERDIITWNALLSCFISNGHAQRAINTFSSMVKNRVQFTGFTVSTVLKACASLLSHSQGLQLHGLAVVTGCLHSLVTATSLVDFYSSCGMVVQAIQVFTGFDCPKDSKMCNTLLSGFVQNQRYNEAFKLLGQTTPNTVGLTCALTACSETLNLEYGKQIHCAVLRHDFNSETILCNALVNMYAKCGEIHSAHSAFSLIEEKNVVSWTCIIDAYGRHGHGSEALELFKEMESAEGSPTGVLPNAVTFLSVLSACGHSGIIDEGRKCLNLMRDKYGIEPGPEHYACFIDMLGKAGRIEEAWDVYSRVAGEGRLNVGVCVAMLNGCKVCMDLERSEVVAQHLMELGEDRAGVYILLSNFYAANGRWEGAENIRKVMGYRGLSKVVGSSQIAIG